MNKGKRPILNTGFSSVLLVFITICLVTFATLSVLTAHSDYKLSTKYGDKTSSYCSADKTAREAMSAIDHTLFSLYTDHKDSASFYNSISEELFLDSLPDSVSDFAISADSGKDDVDISYQVPVSEVQTLYVSLKVSYPVSEKDTFLTITRWQSQTDHALDETEQPMHLYNDRE